jgi:D-glycero-alpha-D-manno-heptose-7-phosphate kinase
MPEIGNILKSNLIAASAPCRIDMGGTLDISIFNYPLRHLNPCTFNIAVNLRTKVSLLPYDDNMVKISSRGFKGAVYHMDDAPFDHPLGLMFAIAAYFRAGGVHIHIDSSSPPRSALGGSSAAAVALVFAFAKVFELKGEQPLSVRETAVLAHTIEESVAGVPCGMQDQLSAAYGGVNAWYWQAGADKSKFRKKVVKGRISHNSLEKHMVIAYCGIPHESKDINGRWVRQFLSGKNRDQWRKIVSYTQRFIDEFSSGNYKKACELMNLETAIRKRMTPDVLDDMGDMLVESAAINNCGARFTGAGGGGCLWALGEAEDISRLKDIWSKILSKRNGASLLDARIDPEGVRSEREALEERFV